MMVTFTDDSGREWKVWQLSAYGTGASGEGGTLPTYTDARIVFESRGEKLTAGAAPIDWESRPEVLPELFARATPF